MRTMTTFQRAFAWTAIPLVVLSLISTGGAWQEALYWAWLLALVVWIGALVAAIICSITQKHQVASGLLAGVGVGFLALFVSCFASLNTGF